jgi:hypothetical protein
MKNKVEWQVVSGGIVLGLLFCIVGLGCGLSACSAEPDSQDGSFAVQSTPQELTPAMAEELRGCFDFFWNEWVADPALPTYGLNAGDYIGLKKTMPLAIESQGFYFPVIVLGVERGWIERSEAEKRVLAALDSLLKLKDFHGFFYHFIDVETGGRGWHSDRVEVSNMSTATMIAGALMAGEYFGGEVREKAEMLYSRIDWNWFLDERQQHFYMACHPEHVPKGRRVDERGMFGHWGAYSEHLIMYILAAGAPEPAHSTDGRPYAAMRTPIGSYRGKPFVFCRTGSAFVYQWTHCFIDFRHMVDAEGRNWFENSRQAALAAHRFAVDSAATVKGLGPKSWGMSASMSPTQGYSGHYGSMPADRAFLDMDGTVAPYGPLGFVVFTPKLSLAALEHMKTIPGLTGKYGLYDAYSFETKATGDQPWIGKSYLAIDKGIVALMFENYATQLIWRYLHRSPHVQRGLRRCGFQVVELTQHEP